MTGTDWSLKSFAELTAGELYDALALRAAVFVVEQECVYPDPDGKDRRAWHLFGYRGALLVGYARIFAPGDYFDECSIGRVVVAPAARGCGLGHELMARAVEAVHKLFGDIPVTISAQQRLEKFYRTHFFEPVGTPYPEDGIPHIRMRRE